MSVWLIVKYRVMSAVLDEGLLPSKGDSRVSVSSRAPFLAEPLVSIQMDVGSTEASGGVLSFLSACVGC